MRAVRAVRAVRAAGAGPQPWRSPEARPLPGEHRPCRVARAHQAPRSAGGLPPARQHTPRAASPPARPPSGISALHHGCLWARARWPPSAAPSCGPPGRPHVTPRRRSIKHFLPVPSHAPLLAGLRRPDAPCGGPQGQHQALGAQGRAHAGSRAVGRRRFDAARLGLTLPAPACPLCSSPRAPGLPHGHPASPRVLSGAPGPASGT
jgi:hypothetical protein